MYAGIGTTPIGCRVWFSFQAVVVQILLAAVEGILMHRRESFFFKLVDPKGTHLPGVVYVLFQRNLCILMILVTLAAGQVASMMISASLSVPSNQHTATCMVVKSNPGNAFFGYD